MTARVAKNQKTIDTTSGPFPGLPSRLMGRGSIEAMALQESVSSNLLQDVDKNGDV